jgi:CO/xanthine dehydrogenase Mo-binding subunit/aerobic-type carbon monoxide dehydrogenase small subunit (CoxS/CutS family)
MELTVNGHQAEVTVDPETPLLSVLRYELGLSGPKEGCAQEQCYACAVLVDGRAMPSCQLPVGRVADAAITTVEGIDGFTEFFIEEQAGQCGFCLSGMIVSAQALLNVVRYPNDDQIRDGLDTNLCRCGVYDRIRRAVKFRIGQPEPDKLWRVLPQAPLESPKLTLSPSITINPELDRWLAINADGTVTVRTGKAELGQGIATAIAQIAASELGVSVSRVRVTGPDTARSPDEGLTAGSLSIEHSGGAIRAAAGAARQRLMATAASVLGADPRGLDASDGTITDPAGGSSVTYWELQGGKLFDQSLTGHVPVAIRPATHAAARIDLPSKLSGQPSFVHDLRLPRMVHGRVIRPAGPGAELESVDLDAAQSMPGVVQVVCDGSFLAVIAEQDDEARAAAEAMAATAVWLSDTVLTDGVEHLMQSATTDYFVVDGTPVDDDVEPIGPLTTSARYSKPLTMHASLGPSAAVAQMIDGLLTVWSSTQGVFVLRDAMAEALSMPPEAVRVIHMEGAGCYGHNGADDVSFDAALLAVSCPGRPIFVKWTRADEHQWEPFSPAMVVQVGARLNNNGAVEAFDLENWSTTHSSRPRATGDGSSGLLATWYQAERRPPLPVQVMRGRHVGAHRNSDPLYTFDDRRIQTHLVTDSPIRTSSTRALGAYANVFAIESFMDELAASVGADPVEFRMHHLSDQRAWAVIEAAAEASGWGDDRPTGSGLGIGFARYKNAQTYLAVVIEASVSADTGQIAIGRAVLAADAGAIVSPDGVSNQLEGGCVQAASWTLREQVQLGFDHVESRDWDTYPILRFSESFPIKVELLDRPDQPSLGCGEAAQGPTAAAIANAVFDACGLRLRDLPLTPRRVVAARALARREA